MGDTLGDTRLDQRTHATVAAQGALAPGASVGPYKLVDKLGSGGMGEVWRAWDAGLCRYAALKLLKGEDADAVERFKREARIAAQMEGHPNIAEVYAAGFSDGRHWIAMRFVDGRTLKSERLCEPRRAAELVLRAARAVGHVHAKGGVHRDIKPDNIMLDKADHLYVMDFGLARSVASKSDLTMSGLVIGTPSYMPPEQADGKPATPASDVWSLGATLYDLLTAVPPFKGETVMETLRAVLNDDVVGVRARRRQVPPQLEAIVTRCLEKEPQRRYSDARELANDLERFLNGRAVEARPASIWRRLHSSLRRHAVLCLAVACCVALAGLIAVAIVYRNSRIAADAKATQARASAEIAERQRMESQRALELDRRNREDADGCVQRAKALYKEDPDAALELCKRAQRLCPQLAEAWGVEGLLEVRRDHFADGVRAYDEALRLRPDCYDFILDRAIAKFGLGHREQAVKDLRGALAGMSATHPARDAFERVLARLEE